ncbi:hypothetical protein Mapa_005462 [Marchantia paleacea]|nr:hypothetical protein Mapa_005462 [Marchantia paleacea]
MNFYFIPSGSVCIIWMHTYMRREGGNLESSSQTSSQTKVCSSWSTNTFHGCLLLTALMYISSKRTPAASWEPTTALQCRRNPLTAGRFMQSRAAPVRAEDTVACVRNSALARLMTKHDQRQRDHYYARTTCTTRGMLTVMCSTRGTLSVRNRLEYLNW